MKKILTIILAMISLFALLTGCQPAATTISASETTETTTAPPTATTAGSDQTTASTSEDTFPVTVVNGAGEEITITSAPQSIVVTNVWAAEILLSLVDASRIKGLSAWGDNPAVSAAAELASAVEARVATGEPEGIVALKPDLVVIDSFSDPDGSLTRTLTDAGATVLMMNSPTDFDQIKAAVATLSAAVGENDGGQTMIAEIDAKLQSVRGKLAGLTDEQRLTVMFYDAAIDMQGNDTGMLCAYGAGSPFDAIAAAAGLTNVVDVANYSSVSKETVVAKWKPEVLVVSSLIYNADFTVSDDQGSSRIAAILSNELLQTLPAIQNNKVIALTGSYASSTSQYMADAVAELAAAAYPELFD